MGRGEIRRKMEWCGCPTVRRQAGRRITLDIGFGLIPGDGPGWMMHRGVLPRSTMDVGRIPADFGAGFRVLCRRGQCTHRHWWPGLVAARWEVEWAGLRWVRAKFMCPPITPVPPM